MSDQDTNNNALPLRDNLVSYYRFLNKMNLKLLHEIYYPADLIFRL